jgi:hypothetical protein
MGSCPAAWKKVRVAQPLRPLPVKYSLFARKITRRSTMSGRKIESMNERWFEARMTAPSFGTFWRPTTQGRKIASRIGPMTMFFMIQ